MSIRTKLMIGKRRSRSRALSAAFLVLSFSELAAQNPSTITSVTKGSNSPIIPGNSNHVTYNDNRSTYKNIRNTYNIYTSSTGHSESSQTDQKLKDSDKLAGARRMAEDGKYLDAISEFKKAANSGDSDAMVEVGRIYLAGKGGILKNREEARVWFAKASDQGNAAVPVQLKFEEEAKEERSFRRRELWSETFEERTKTLERRGEDETAAPAFD